MLKVGKEFYHGDIQGVEFDNEHLNVLTYINQFNVVVYVTPFLIGWYQIFASINIT
jgi:hypothetical protein